MFRREFLKLSSYLLGFLGIPALSFGEENSNNEYTESTEKKYDKNGNLIYEKFPNGFEFWYEYDKNNNEIHFWDGSQEYWAEYDENNREIYYKSSYSINFIGGTNGTERWWEYNKNNILMYEKNLEGKEYWYKYNKYDKPIKITKKEFKGLKREKEFLSRNYHPQFEIYWYE